MPFDIRIPANTTLGLVTGNAIIFQSCNGLLLCCTRNMLDRFYVYNPSINKFKIILHFIGTMRMAFNPRKSPHYKLVHTRVIDGSVQIQTYTLETGNSSVCDSLFPEKKSFLSFHKGIYWNDAIHHWENYENPNEPLHFKLDVDHPALTRIPTPRISKVKGYCERELFVSHGCLLLVSVYTDYTHSCSRHLNVYEMSNWYFGWSLIEERC